MHAPDAAAPFSASPEPESKRTLANRLNAQKSTGPRTAEGKERSRRNAVKHGLAGSGKCLPDDLGSEQERRVEEWTASLNPKDSVERDLVELGASAMTRVRHCWREESAARGRAAERAGRVWEMDRRAEAERKAGWLASDPGRVAAELRRGRFGAEWMVGKWRELGRRLEAGRAWTEVQRGVALDLLGISPEFRDGLTPIDFPGADTESEASALQTLVSSEIAGLESEIDRHLLDLDDDERFLRIDDLDVVGDAEVGRLRRYERALSNRVLTVLATLRRGPASGDETKPSPTKSQAPADSEPALPVVTISTEPISAMQVAPSLVPPPSGREEATPDDYREWLRSRTDSDVETMLLPLLMARLASMQQELAEKLASESNAT